MPLQYFFGDICIQNQKKNYFCHLVYNNNQSFLKSTQTPKTHNDCHKNKH